MRRLLIFTALFPALTLLTFFAPDIVRKLELPPFEFLRVSALIAYYVAILPALASTAADYGLRHYPFRIVGTVIVGVAAALIAAHFHGHGLSTPLEFIHVALMGAIPAAVCSWLSGRAA
jgi:hypothetical protein